ncbi:hypothetical protein M3Y95_00033300 [Aphelenchoides besseyi]|nr:hypothetical protein M3Y95_00033300 [Aphelenchoides besseyi]
MRVGSSTLSIVPKRSRNVSSENSIAETKPKLKRIANQVKNARRIGLGNTNTRAPEVESSNANEPHSPIYSVGRSNVFTLEDSKRDYPFRAFRQRIRRFFTRRHHSNGYLTEMQEISKKMKPVEKARDFCPLPCLQPTREVPIWHKVRSRHLELEPLCSCQSLIIRGGCATIVVCELLSVFCTTLLIFLKVFYNKNDQKIFWRDFQWNFNSKGLEMETQYLLNFSTVKILCIKLCFNQKSFYYKLIAITLLMAVVLARAIIRFERLYAKLHWQYDFFALAFYVTTFVLYTVALVSNSSNWNFIDLLLAASLGLQIPVQLWAIAVVKDCFHFFNLLYVLIMIAE